MLIWMVSSDGEIIVLFDRIVIKKIVIIILLAMFVVTLMEISSMTVRILAPSSIILTKTISIPMVSVMCVIRRIIDFSNQINIYL